MGLALLVVLPASALPQEPGARRTGVRLPRVLRQGFLLLLRGVCPAPMPAPTRPLRLLFLRLRLRYACQRHRRTEATASTSSTSTSITTTTGRRRAAVGTVDAAASSGAKGTYTRPGGAPQPLRVLPVPTGCVRAVTATRHRPKAPLQFRREERLYRARRLRRSVPASVICCVRHLFRPRRIPPPTGWASEPLLLAPRHLSGRFGPPRATTSGARRWGLRLLPRS